MMGSHLGHFRGWNQAGLVQELRRRQGARARKSHLCLFFASCCAASCGTSVLRSDAGARQVMVVLSERALPPDGKLF